MNNLLKFVQSATPGQSVQFRRKAYGKEGVRQFLRDVLAMANADIDGARYIITGAEVDENGRKKAHGVSKRDFSGDPSYESLVTEFIEPPIRIRYRPVTISGKNVGAYVIADCQDKPYMMRIDQSEKLRRGDAYIRLRDMPVKMGRRQLQDMFEKKFRDSVSADRIEIGFPGDIIHKDLKIATVDLSGMPSAAAAAKLNQLLEAQAQTHNTGSTTVMARLTHARLFGSDDPYQVRTPDELIKEVAQIERKHRDEDDYFLFEKNVKKLQLVVFNQGDDIIEDASLSLVLPTHEAFHVARNLPKKLIKGEYHNRSAAELADYPAVNIKDELVHVSNTLGDVPPHAPVKVFEIPMRICAGYALKGRKIGIRYSLFGSNLRKPARGQLRLIF
jgi:hypothetical protein